MDILKKLSSQLSNLWNSWSRLQQVGIVAVTLVCVLSIVGLGMWASSKEYVALINQLTPTKAHEVISALQAEGIDYKLNYSGSGVSVPNSDVSRARLAIKEIGIESEIEEETGMGFWNDPSQQYNHQQRQLERRIAASIKQIHSIKDARVHLSQPESTPFLRSQPVPKASIVLELAPNKQFSSLDARAVASLVSHAVEKLDPENVSIVDTHGNSLTDGNQSAGDVSGQLEYRRRLEGDLSSKAEAMLTPLLGYGKAVVRVSVDIDFTEKTSDRKTYDPDTKVKVTETINTETVTGPASQPGAGTSSNTGGLTLKGGPGNTTSSETIDTAYLNTEIVDKVREVPGSIKRMTVAAVVELPTPNTEADASVEAAAVSKITTEQVQKIIQQAVGFDLARNDEIEVIASKLTGVELLPEVGGWASFWEEAKPMMGPVSLGLASLVALFLGLSISSKLKPMIVEVDRRDRLTPEMRAKLADLSEDMKQHPDAVSTVFSAWLAGQDQADVSRKKAA